MLGNGGSDLVQEHPTSEAEVVAFLTRASQEGGAGQQQLQELLKVDQAIREHVYEINERMRLLQEMERGEREVKERIDRIHAFLKPRESLQENLQDLLVECKKFHSVDRVPISEVWDGIKKGDAKWISWASRLGRATFAPPMDDDMMRWFLPPAPQEDMMRASLLYRQQQKMSISMDQMGVGAQNGVSKMETAAQPAAGLFSTRAAEQLLDGEDWLFDA
jgi:hypothetical protein